MWRFLLTSQLNSRTAWGRLAEALISFLKYCERYYSAKIKFEPVFYHLSDRPNVSFILKSLYTLPLESPKSALGIIGSSSSILRKVIHCTTAEQDFTKISPDFRRGIFLEDKDLFIMWISCVLTNNVLQSSQCQLGKTLDTFYGDLRLGKVILEFHLEREFLVPPRRSISSTESRQNSGKLDEASANGKWTDQFHFEREFWYR